MALGLAVGAIATPTVQRRDVTAVAASIAAIATDITTFDGDVNAYTGGTPTTIQSDSDKIVSDTNSAISAVSAVPSFSDTDAELLIPPIQALNSSINTAIDDLIAKKDALVAACAGDQTLGDLNQQLSTASTLADSITARVSTDLQPLAAELSAPIIAAINRGIDAFTGANTCSSSSSSSPPPATSSSTSAPGTTPTSVATPTTTPGTYPTTVATSAPNGYPTSSPIYPETTPTYPATSPTYPATSPVYPVSTPSGSGVASGTGVTPCSTGAGSPPPPYTTGESAPTYPVGTGGNGGSPTTSAGGSGSTPPPPPPITGAATQLSGSVGLVVALVAILAL